MFVMKDGKVQPAQARITAAPTYTLADIIALIERYKASQPIDSATYLRGLFLDGLVKFIEKEEEKAHGSSAK